MKMKIPFKAISLLFCLQLLLPSHVLALRRQETAEAPGASAGLELALGVAPAAGLETLEQQIRAIMHKPGRIVMLVDADASVLPVVNAFLNSRRNVVALRQVSTAVPLWGALLEHHPKVLGTLSRRRLIELSDSLSDDNGAKIRFLLELERDGYVDPITSQWNLAQRADLEAWINGFARKEIPADIRMALDGFDPLALLNALGEEPYQEAIIGGERHYWYPNLVPGTLAVRTHRFEMEVPLSFNTPIIPAETVIEGIGPATEQLWKWLIQGYPPAIAPADYLILVSSRSPAEAFGSIFAKGLHFRDVLHLDPTQPAFTALADPQVWHVDPASIPEPRWDSAANVVELLSEAGSARHDTQAFLRYAQRLANDRQVRGDGRRLLRLVAAALCHADTIGVSDSGGGRAAAAIAVIDRLGQVPFNTQVLRWAVQTSLIPHFVESDFVVTVDGFNPDQLDQARELAGRIGSTLRDAVIQQAAGLESDWQPLTTDTLLEVIETIDQNWQFMDLHDTVYRPEEPPDPAGNIVLIPVDSNDSHLADRHDLYELAEEGVWQFMSPSASAGLEEANWEQWQAVFIQEAQDLISTFFLMQGGYKLLYSYAGTIFQVMGNPPPVSEIDNTLDLINQNGQVQIRFVQGQIHLMSLSDGGNLFFGMDVLGEIQPDNPFIDPDAADDSNEWDKGGFDDLYEAGLEAQPSVTAELFSQAADEAWTQFRTRFAEDSQELWDRIVVISPSFVSAQGEQFQRAIEALEATSMGNRIILLPKLSESFETEVAEKLVQYLDVPIVYASIYTTQRNLDNADPEVARFLQMTRDFLDFRPSYPRTQATLYYLLDDILGMLEVPKSVRTDANIRAFRDQFSGLESAA